MAKKLCIVFPGRRYSTDRSLLYFPSRMMESLGFEVVNLHYDIPREVEETEPLMKNIRDAASYAVNHTDEIDWAKYDTIVFLSKSIGTVVASNLKKFIGEQGKKVHQIMITPLDEALPLMDKDDLIIVGDHDRFFADPKKKLALFPNAYIFPSLTHSLEAKGDYRTTLKALTDICGIVDSYLNSIGD